MSKSRATLAELIELYEELENKTGNLSHTISNSLETITLPIEIWWLVLTSVELAIFGTIGLPVTLAVLLGCAGLFIYELIFSRDKLNKTKTKINNQFSELLNEIIENENKIVERQEKLHALNPELQLKPTDFIERAKTRINSDIPVGKRKSVSAAGAAGLSLTLTTLAIASILHTLQFISLGILLATPIGWGMVTGLLVASIIVGAVIGYKHYQERKNAKMIVLEQTKLEKIVKEQTGVINDLSQKIIDIRFEKAEETREKIKEPHEAKSIQPTLVAQEFSGLRVHSRPRPQPGQTGNTAALRKYSM